MNKKISLLLTMASLTVPAFMASAQTSSTSVSAASQTNTTTSKIEDLKKPTEKMKDTDEEITDARMRAQLGSKSKFSFKSGLNYSGGSVEEPFSGVRPNYRSSASAYPVMATLSGDIGMNYRFGERDNLNIGTGITIIDPFHGNVFDSAKDTRPGRDDKALDRYEASSPFIAWSRGYRAFDIQMISGFTYSHATDADSLNISKTFGNLTYNQTFLANFGTTKWNGGTTFSLSKNFYSADVDDPATLKAMAAGKYKRSEITGGLFPFLQYTFNDRYSFRTVFGYFQFARYENQSDTAQIEPYQSMGAGISITRDIYLYPNIQFTPKDIRADRTNVALSTNINLF